MTNYHDGKWHRWDGVDKSPVHPKTIVEAYWLDLNLHNQGKTEEPREAVESEGPRLAWSHVTAFRVVKEYREPREWWIAGVTVFQSSRDAKIAYPGSDPVHVREVLK